jgi:signal transduction histidine kinase
MAEDPRQPPVDDDLPEASIDRRMTQLGSAVAAVAHEINSPISYVLGNLTELEHLTGAMQEAIGTYRALLRRGSPRDASEQIANVEEKLEQSGGLGLLDELLSDTREGARRIRDLARDLIAAARGAELRKEVFDVAELIDSTLRLATPHFTVPAEIERDYRAARHVAADRAKLGQVLLNLIANAADACAAGRAEKPRISIRTRDCDTGVVIEVEDSGEGIPENVRAQLFTPFFTTKQPGAGTGLGLYISRRLVEEHGGSLVLECPESGGTIFSVYLPVEET